jgi:hypothetical protein
MLSVKIFLNYAAISNPVRLNVVRTNVFVANAAIQKYCLNKYKNTFWSKKMIKTEPKISICQ